MNRFTNYFASVFQKIRSSHRSTRMARVSNQSRLNLESMDERCMPSVSPMTLSSAHEVSHGPSIVAHDTVLSKMSKMDVAISLSPGGDQRKH
jgi:hypothetical protein